MTFTFWNYYVLKLLRLEPITFSDATLSDINVVLCYVLKLLRLETITFSDATLSDINVVLCYVLSQYQ